MEKLRTCAAILALGLLIAFNGARAEQPSEGLPELKAAAERGDSQAQDKLADYYHRRFERDNALIWYRKAASQGVTNSQFKLAQILLNLAKSPAAKPELSKFQMDEGIHWLTKAASHGFKPAQIELGVFYSEGTYVQKNVVEACKWLSLALKDEGQDKDHRTRLATRYRDALILAMTRPQINDTQMRIAAFVPNSTEAAAPPEPAYLKSLKLEGVTGALLRPLAIINGKLLSIGESATIKLEGRLVIIRCNAIGNNSATVSVDGLARPRILSLH